MSEALLRLFISRYCRTFGVSLEALLVFFTRSTSGDSSCCKQFLDADPLESEQIGLIWRCKVVVTQCISIRANGMMDSFMSRYNHYSHSVIRSQHLCCRYVLCIGAPTLNGVVHRCVRRSYKNETLVELDTQVASGGPRCC